MEMMMSVILFIVAVFSLLTIISFIRPQKRPTERLEMWMSTYQEPDVQEEKREHKGIISKMGSLAEKLGIGRKLMERTRMELVRADIPLTGYEFNIARAIIAVVLSAVFFVMTKAIVTIILVPIVVWVVANAYVSSLKNKRMKLFSGQLGDSLTLFSNSLRAGFSFLQAVSSVAREMPDPVAKEFTILLKEMSLGLSVEKALSNLMMRVPLDDLELLVIAILIQKEVGGNLAEIIDTIAGTIRERITIQLEVKALTAQGKMSGFVVGLLPFLLGLGMYAINPAYIGILFTEPAGQVMVAIGLVSMMFGIFAISKIVKIEV